MVIDEAAFIKELALNEAILPTLSATGKKCLIISTPKSKNWFYKFYILGKEENSQYVSFEGISIDNPHVDQNFILEQEKSLPPDIYKQEYLAKFTDAGSDVFTNVDAVCLISEYSNGSTQEIDILQESILAYQMIIQYSPLWMEWDEFIISRGLMERHIKKLQKRLQIVSTDLKSKEDLSKLMDLVSPYLKHFEVTIRNLNHSSQQTNRKTKE